MPVIRSASSTKPGRDLSRRRWPRWRGRCSSPHLEHRRPSLDGQVDDLAHVPRIEGSDGGATHGSIVAGRVKCAWLSAQGKRRRWSARRRARATMVNVGLAARCPWGTSSFRPRTGCPCHAPGRHRPPHRAWGPGACEWCPGGGAHPERSGHASTSPPLPSTSRLRNCTPHRAKPSANSSWPRRAVCESSSDSCHLSSTRRQPRASRSSLSTTRLSGLGACSCTRFMPNRSTPTVCGTAAATGQARYGPPARGRLAGDVVHRPEAGPTSTGDARLGAGRDHEADVGEAIAPAQSGIETEDGPDPVARYLLTRQRRRPRGRRPGLHPRGIVEVEVPAK